MSFFVIGAFVETKEIIVLIGFAIGNAIGCYAAMKIPRIDNKDDGEEKNE